MSGARFFSFTLSDDAILCRPFFCLHRAQIPAKPNTVLKPLSAVVTDLRFSGILFLDRFQSRLRRTRHRLRLRAPFESGNHTSIPGCRRELHPGESCFPYHHLFKPGHGKRLQKRSPMYFLLQPAIPVVTQHNRLQRTANHDETRRSARSLTDRSDFRPKAI